MTGWGTLWKNHTGMGDWPNELREVDVKIISNEQCSGSGIYDDITDKMLCAAEENGNGGKDSCYGDSGGKSFSQNNFVSYPQAICHKSCIITITMVKRYSNYGGLRPRIGSL